MNKMVRSCTLLSIIAVLVVGLVFSGCSNDTPLGPDSNVEQTSLNRMILPLGGSTTTQSKGGGVGDLTVVTAVEVDKVIKASSGGKIDIVDNSYEHLFTIQENAIPTDTLITIAKTHEMVNENESAVFEFGPDGLVFSSSSVLEFEMAELDSSAATAKLYYYDPSDETWDLQDTKSVVDGKVAFDIDHFSRYAISD
ncbi:MAG: hypothetical protein J7K40_05120 [candidate division Zixibacteria bacterium]|nr:hypothetical protein [candidate division Zixibacteria bacterium]